MTIPNNPHYYEEIDNPNNPDEKIIKNLETKDGIYQPTNFGTEDNPRWIILVKDKMTIRFVFDPSSGSRDVESDFFDYDITNGSIYESQPDAQSNANPQDTSTQGNMRAYAKTNQQGINSSQNYSDQSKPKLAFGNANTGTGLASQKVTIGGVENFFNRYNEANRHTLGGGAVFGLVTGLNSDGTLVWNSAISAPALFDKKNSLTGKTNYTNNEFGLHFNRTGGTYILDSVTKNKNGTKTTIESASDLSRFDNIVNSIYSNQFWPMDAAGSYGTDGHDLKFGKAATPGNYDSGQSNKNNFVGQSTPAGTINIGTKIKDYEALNASGTFPRSDDAHDHNAYFGMTFSTDFYVDPGYAGPLRYYFYGDDDLFVFLSKVEGEGENERLVATQLVADLGGVHSSVGMYVNLWKYVNGGNGPIEYTDSSGTQRYRLTYYYTERGSSGSTCYMRFTLPFESMDTTPRVYNGSLQVEKEVKAQPGSTADDEKDYTFRLELRNNDNNGAFVGASPLLNRYGYEIINADGSVAKETTEDPDAYNGSTFKLKHGQKFRLTEQLPKGTLYKVTELNEDVITTFASGAISSSNPDGEIFTDYTEGKEINGSTEVNEQTGEGDNYVKFINATAPASLALSKIVNADGDRTTDSFNFIVTLISEKNEPITQISVIKNGQEEKDLKAENGVYNLTLLDKDSYILYNLPQDTKFKIEEASNSQYVVDGIQVAGSSTAQVLTEMRTVTGVLTAPGQITDQNRPKVEVTYTNKVELNTTAQIHAQKTITGRSVLENENYTFEMRADPDDQDAPAKLAESVYATATFKNDQPTAIADFSPITFTKDDVGKKFDFLVSEVNGGKILDHLEYDNSVYRVSIAVTQENEAADLSTETKWTKVGADPTDSGEGDTVKFNNRYRPETELSISFTKLIEGPVKAGDKYEFTISAEDGTPLPENNGVELIASADLASSSAIEEKKISGTFDPITYTEKDKTYTYTISEIVKSSEDNLIEDDTQYKVTVNVTEDKGENGFNILKAEITNVEPTTAQNTIVFTNVYQYTELSIPVTKYLDGRLINANDLFQFELYEGDNLLQSISLGGSQYIDKKEMHGTFAPIPYEAPGMHSYTVKEKQGNAENIFYDKTEYQVTVNVVEGEDKHLNAEMTIDGDQQQIAFRNIYITSKSWTPTPTKLVKGGSNAGHSFTASITKENGDPIEDADGVSDIPDNVSVMSKEDGTIPFAPYVFTKQGKFKVEVTENKPEDGILVDGILYDTHTLTYSLDVALNEANGELTVNPTLSGSDQFVNDAGLTIEKQLIAGTDTVLSETDIETSFEFDLSFADSDGNPLTGDYPLLINGENVGSLAVINGNGTIYLKKDDVARIYDLPIGAHYEVNEVSKDGYLLMSSQNTKGQIGTGIGSGQRVLFINIKPSTIEGEIHGNKQLINTEGSNIEGATRVMKEGEFSFSIEPVGAELEKWTGKISDDSQVILKENNPDSQENENTHSGENDWTSDDVSNSESEEQKAEKPVVVRETADVTEIPMPQARTVSNNTNGEFFFDPIRFEHAGTYIYRISEDKGKDDEIRYDSNSYLAIVEVENVLLNDEIKTGVKIKEIRYQTENNQPINNLSFINEFIGTPDLNIHKYQSLNNGDRTQDLLIGKSGDLVRYDLVVSVPVSATAPAREVKVSDFIPQPNRGSDIDAELIFIDGSQGIGTYNKQTREITWNLGMITPGNSVTVSYIVQIPGVTKQASWTNIATARYENNPAGSNTPIPSEDVTVETNQLDPAIGITKWQAKGTGAFQKEQLNVLAKDIVTYELRVSNTGLATAENVVVTDTVPDGLKLVENSISNEGKVDQNGLITWNLGSLAPGGRTSVSFRVEVPVVKEATNWTNTGYVHYDDPNNPDNKTPSNDVEIETDVPDLTIEKLQQINEGEFVKGDDPIRVSAKDIVTYKLIVANPSKVDTINSILVDEIPEGLVYVENSAQGANIVNGKLVWALGTIKAGESVEKTFQVKVPKVKEYTLWQNQGTVTYENNPNNPEDPDKPRTPIDSNIVKIDTIVPIIKIRKEQALNSGERQEAILHGKSGDEVTYYLRVTNSGDATAQSVQVSDEIPEGLILKDGTISNSGKLNGNTIEWSLGDLDAGQEKTVSFTVTIPEVKKSTSWLNVAAAVFGNNPDNPEDPDEPKTEIPSNEVEVDTQTPSLIIEKLQKTGEGEFQKESLAVNSGDTVTYKLIVTNDGTATAQDITITDTIPEGLVYQSASDDGVFNSENATITWNVDSLEAGESVERTFNVQVPQAEGTRIWTNIGYTSFENNPNNPEDSNEPDTPIPSNKVEIYTPTPDHPHIILRKEQQLNDGKPTPLPLIGNVGDKVTYYLTVTNTGEKTADDVVVKDDIPSGLEFIENSISDEGVLEGRKVIWSLGFLEPGQSKTVSFQAVLPKVTQNTTWKNIGIVTYSNNPEGPDKETPSNEVVIETELPEVTIEKLQSLNGSAFTKDPYSVKDRDIVTYKLIIKNIGKTTANKVVIRDAIPEGLTYVDKSVSDNGKYVSGILTWEIGDLKVGESKEVTFRVKVPAVTKATVWKNVGSVVYENNPNGPDSETPSNEVIITNLNCPDCEKCPDDTVCPPPTRPTYPVVPNNPNNSGNTTNNNNNSDTRNPSVNVPDTNSPSTNRNTTTNNTTTTTTKSDTGTTTTKKSTNTSVETGMLGWSLMAAGGLVAATGFWTLDRKKQKKDKQK